MWCTDALPRPFVGVTSALATSGFHQPDRHTVSQPCLAARTFAAPRPNRDDWLTVLTPKTHRMQ
jgi:hypothetical protein